METIPTEELFEFNSDIFPELGNYKITKTGKIWSNKKNDFLESKINNGYYHNVLTKNKKNYSIHRLVALNFIPIPNNKKLDDLVVNHINENKLDNRVENLEWCSQKENCNAHSKETSHSKKVIKMDFDGNELEIFNSMTEAGESIGLTRHAIGKACGNNNKKAGGFKWKYAEDKEKIVNFTDAKVIRGYNNYLVFPNGIICDKKGNIIKPWGGNQKNGNGYQITLCKKFGDEGYIEPSIENEKIKYKINYNNIYVHRIVAAHFLNESENVNASVIHINKNKLDNRVENLKYDISMPTINNSFGIEEVKVKDIIKPKKKKKKVDLSDAIKVKGFNNYYIFSDGRVYKTDKNRPKFLTEKEHRKSGALMVHLSKSNGKYQCICTHILLAKHFIPNNENKKNVKHKNGNNQDNRIENLYWC